MPTNLFCPVRLSLEYPLWFAANDPKTICELFYVCCDDIQDIELCTALYSLVVLFMEGIRTEAIRITKAVKTQLINWFVFHPAFIKALFPETFTKFELLMLPKISLIAE